MLKKKNGQKKKQKYAPESNNKKGDGGVAAGLPNFFQFFLFKMEVCASLLGYGVYWDRAPQ